MRSGTIALHTLFIILFDSLKLNYKHTYVNSSKLSVFPIFHSLKERGIRVNASLKVALNTFMLKHNFRSDFWYAYLHMRVRTTYQTHTHTYVLYMLRTNIGMQISISMVGSVWKLAQLWGLHSLAWLISATYMYILLP